MHAGVVLRTFEDEARPRSRGRRAPVPEPLLLLSLVIPPHRFRHVGQKRSHLILAVPGGHDDDAREGSVRFHRRGPSLSLARRRDPVIPANARSDPLAGIQQPLRLRPRARERPPGKGLIRGCTHFHPGMIANSDRRTNSGHADTQQQ